MKKIFALVVSLIIFSVVNFANATHHYVYTEDDEDGKFDLYIDTDELGIVYNDSKYETYYNDLANKHSGDTLLKFSKDKNKISSNATLFKVRIVAIDKNNNLKPKLLDWYFYRQMGEVKYSVFNDFEVDYLTYSLTRKKNLTVDHKSSGIRCIYFGSENGCFDDLILPYSNDYPLEPFIPMDFIYNKARELFGVKNNYKDYDSFIKNYFENKTSGLLQFSNYVRRYSDPFFPEVYCGIDYLTGYGSSSPLHDVFLVKNSPIGTKNNLFCVTKLNFHGGNVGKYFGFHFWTMAGGILVCENVLGEFLGPVSRDKTELLYNIYVEAVKALKN